MKFILMFLGLIAISHNCNGNIVEDGEKVSNVISIENSSVVESWPDDLHNDTASNVSYIDYLNGFGKTVVGRIKVGIKSIKNKIKNFKIGGGGGTSGGGGGGSYHRPHISGRGGSSSNNPNGIWIFLGVCTAIVLICLIAFYCKGKNASEELVEIAK